MVFILLQQKPINCEQDYCPEPGATASSADRMGRAGGCLLVVQQRGLGDAVGKMPVRCKKELPG